MKKVALVFALAVTSDGRILAGDLQRGLFDSKDGGKSWAQVIRATILGLARAIQDRPLRREQNSRIARSRLADDLLRRGAASGLRH